MQVMIVRFSTGKQASKESSAKKKKLTKEELRNKWGQK